MCVSVFVCVYIFVNNSGKHLHPNVSERLLRVTGVVTRLLNVQCVCDRERECMCV